MISGIIPAYAGNTCLESKHCNRKRDHPRVCGEHTIAFPRSKPGVGSSPRMRGTLGGGGVGYTERGIIPAYAGNTDNAKRVMVNTRDHPRVCGEHTKRLA